MKARARLSVLLILVFMFAVYAPANAATSTVADSYPRTQVNFLYHDYSFRYVSGEPRTINCMIIPVHFTDGYGYDDLFYSQIENTINGGEYYSVRKYYRYASYGRVELQYEMMPVYDLGMSLLEMQTKLESPENWSWYYELFWQMYDRTRAAYKGDLSKFDTDNDGYADMVIYVFDDPSDDADNIFGSFVSSAYVTSMDNNRCLYNANHSYPSCAQYVCIEKYMVMQDYFIKTSQLWEGYGLYFFQRLNHEIGHLFGIIDYYYYDDLDEYDGHTVLGFDMHDTEKGDLNPWSKMSVGWIDPYVITPDIDEVTIKLRCSALYPDCILIPTSNGWNGTPFDEFILVDVLGKAGNNKADWDEVMLFDQQQGDPPQYGGVRIMHVDQRLCTIDYSANSSKWFDPSRAFNYDRKGAHPYIANCMGIGIAAPYSPDPNSEFYFPLHTMTRTNKTPYFEGRNNSYGWYDFVASDLFMPGDSFSMESHAAAFANAPYMNNFGTFDYEITVTSYNPDTMEALVTVKRINGTPAAAGTLATTRKCTVMQGTYVRQSPSASSAAVGYIEYETELEYISVENGWYLVKLNDGSSGYIYQSRVK